MNDHEIAERLSAALTELPGGPIVPPVGIGARASRYRRRRNAITVVATVVAVLVASGGTVLLRADSPARRAQPAATQHEPCIGAVAGLTIAPLPAGAQPRRIAQEVRALVPAQHPASDVYAALVTNPLAAKLHVGSPTVARLTWVVDGIYVFHRPGQWSGPLQRLKDGTITRELTLIDDEKLALGGIFACQFVDQSLNGSTAESPTAPRIHPLVTATAEGVVIPYVALTPVQEPVPWTLQGVRGDGRRLIVVFPTGCHDKAAVQVRETERFVIIRVVRLEPPSHRLCLTQGRAIFTLLKPLGDRLLVHAASTRSGALDPSPASCTEVAAAGPPSWQDASKVQFVTTPGTNVTVEAEYDSTAAVVNLWSIGGQIEPITDPWPLLPSATPVRACWLRGSFVFRRGGTATRVLVEVSGSVSKLIVAGSPQQQVRVVKPPES